MYPKEICTHISCLLQLGDALGNSLNISASQETELNRLEKSHYEGPHPRKLVPETSSDGSDIATATPPAAVRLAERSYG